MTIHPLDQPSNPLLCIRHGLCKVNLWKIGTAVFIAPHSFGPRCAEEECVHVVHLNIWVFCPKHFVKYSWSQHYYLEGCSPQLFGCTAVCSWQIIFWFFSCSLNWPPSLSCSSNTAWRYYLTRFSYNFSLAFSVAVSVTCGRCDVELSYDPNMCSNWKESPVIKIDACRSERFAIKRLQYHIARAASWGHLSPIKLVLVSVCNCRNNP